MSLKAADQTPQESSLITQTSLAQSQKPWLGIFVVSFFSIYTRLGHMEHTFNNMDKENSSANKNTNLLVFPTNCILTVTNIPYDTGR